MTDMILAFLTFHFCADFMMQSREMAKNKSKSLYWLSRHTFVYTLTFFIMSFIVLTGELAPAPLACFVLINGLLHGITDFFTSKASSYCYKQMEMDDEIWEHRFWCVIGYDQLIHTTTLILTYKYIFGIS